MSKDSAQGSDKSDMAFRTIGEVAADLDIPAHVLRFWETKFTFLKPVRPGRGRRYYRQEDIELLRGIRELLYTDGYTIKGVQKLGRKVGAKKDIRRRGSSDWSAPGSEEATGNNERSGVAEEVGVLTTGEQLSGERRRVLREVLSDLEKLRAQISK